MDCRKYKLDLIKANVNCFVFLDGCRPVVTSGKIELLNIRLREDIQWTFRIIDDFIYLECSVGWASGTICVFVRLIVKVHVLLEIQATHFEAALEANAWSDRFDLSINIDSGHPLHQCLILLDSKLPID